MTKKKKFSMKKLLKKISLISGIVIVAFLIILALIPVLFKSKILQIVKNEANKSLNATVEFSDVSLSLFRGFPSINMKLKDLYVVGIDEFEQDTLIKFDELSANLNLKSVVFGNKIKVNSIVLEKPDIYVKVLYDGKANYDIVKTDSTDTDEPDNEEKDEEPKKDDKAFIIALKKFEINNANIIYDDKEIDIYSVIENLNFNLKGDLSEDFTSIELLLTIDSLTVNSEGIQYVDRASFLFDSELDADMVKQKYTFKDNLLKINEIELGFDGYVEMPDSNITMDISFATRVTEFKSLLSMIPAVYQKDFDDIQTSGTFKFEGFAKGTYNSESIPAFEVDFAVNDAWFQYPELPQAVTDINIAVHVENPGDIDINTIDISRFQFKMAKNPVNAKIYVKTSAADIYTKGDINAKINLSTVSQFYPLEDNMTLSGLLDMDLGFKGNLSDIENENYENFHSEGRFLITDMITKQEDLPPITISKTELVFSPDIAELKTFDAQIGKSDIHLDGKIFNLFQYVFSDDVLTANFNLTSKLFDANDFMSYDESESESETETESESETNSETTATKESEITAFEVPANIDFTLNSSINKVFYEKLKITNLLGQIKIADSKLSLTNLSMNLLKGSMRLTAVYDAKDIQNPYAEFSFNMNKIDIIETYNAFLTIQELAPIVENCTGRISASFSANTNLDYNLNPVYNTLNGKGNFSSNNISVTGNKVFSILANLTKNKAYKNPTVSNLFLEFEITDGNVEIKPTSFTLAQTEASIEGTTNLDKTIDYQLGIVVPKNTATNLISNLPFIKLKENVEIYANIGGTIDDPKIIDFGSNFTDNVKDDIIEGLSEAAKKYLQEVKAKADKLVADAKAKRDKLVKDAENEVARLKKKAKDEADKLLDDAKKRGDTEINKATNPVAKKLAKEVAARLLEEAKKEANKKIEQGNKETLGLVQKATKKGDKLVKTAENDADKMVKDAEKKAETM